MLIPILIWYFILFVAGFTVGRSQAEYEWRYPNRPDDYDWDYWP